MQATAASRPFWRRSLTRWLLASLVLHVAAALWLAQREVTVRRSPAETPPMAVRVVLREPPPDPAPAPPDVSAPPSQPVAKPKPAPRPTPKPVAEPQPVPSEPTRAPAERVEPVAAAPAVPQPAPVAAPAPPGPPPEELLDDYKALLLGLIAQHKQYPALARRRGIEGDVTLRLRIDPSGKLTGLETVGRSPLVLARQARSAAERAAPSFPPPPDGEFLVDFVLRFDLTE